MGFAVISASRGDAETTSGVERFFGSLRGERMALRHYATRQEARDDVVDYVEMF
jgi:hypothetical protein